MEKIYAVGMGPGNAGQMTAEAREVIVSCDVIAGYTVYVDLVRKELKESELEGKEFITTPMTQEVKRCRLAFEQAQKGKRVAMVCKIGRAHV